MAKKYAPSSRTIFPGKNPRAISFNLTPEAIKLLEAQSAKEGLSKSDHIEQLIRVAGSEQIEILKKAKQASKKSIFGGKDCHNIPAVSATMTNLAHKLLDSQVQAAGISRGDYIEYLLREKAGALGDLHKRIADLAASKPLTTPVGELAAKPPESNESETKPISLRLTQQHIDHLDKIGSGNTWRSRTIQRLIESDMKNSGAAADTARAGDWEVKLKEVPGALQIFVSRPGFFSGETATYPRKQKKHEALVIEVKQ